MEKEFEKELEKVTLPQIRILKIEIEHFKNIEYGAFTFPSYGMAKKHGAGKGQDILGVYGQNGSGKTAIVEALIVWQLMQQKLRIPEEYRSLIQKDCRIQLLFQLVEHGAVSQVSLGYLFEEKGSVSPKLLTTIRLWDGERWSRKRKRVDSFVLEELELFSKQGLWIATPRQLGLVQLNMGTTTDFALHENKGISLFEENVLPTKSMYHVERVVSQLNTVLRSLIPGLTIELDTSEEEDDCRFRLLARRYDMTFPLQNESGGIKRLLSVLATLIAGYNQPSLCVVIDEIDSGIFEYLLGDLLENMRTGAKGQFLFTSHNLRALEVLGVNHIVFSTANPKNRFIQFTNIKKKQNLRDEYLRALLIGGQKEELQEETKEYRLGYAFRKAGKLYDET